MSSGQEDEPGQERVENLGHIKAAPKRRPYFFRRKRYGLSVEGAPVSFKI
jgi:hypothetical protein